MLASNHGHDGVVKVLVQVGATVDLQDVDGLSALMYASREGRKDVAMTLMKYGAQVDLADKYGHSALWLAQLNVVLTLLDKTKVSVVDWC